MPSSLTIVIECCRSNNAWLLTFIFHEDVGSPALLLSNNWGANCLIIIYQTGETLQLYRQVPNHTTCIVGGLPVRIRRATTDARGDGQGGRAARPTAGAGMMRRCYAAVRCDRTRHIPVLTCVKTTHNTKTIMFSHRTILNFLKCKRVDLA